MKRMMRWIGKMKKSKNEGFSLVELIIVISIMAILMGVVGTQVLPYLNKSKESNDNAILSKFHTAAVSAFAFNADNITSGEDYTITIAANDTIACTTTPSITDGDVVLTEWKTLTGITSGTALTYFKNTASSPNGKAVDKIEIKYAGADGKITLQAWKGTDEVLKTIESK